VARSNPTQSALWPEGLGVTVSPAPGPLSFSALVRSKGRDIEEIENGDATEVRRTDERKAILDALRESCDPLSPTAITTLTGMKGPNVRKLLEKMVKAGEIFKAGRGKYSHLDHQPAAKTE